MAQCLRFVEKRVVGLSSVDDIQMPLDKRSGNNRGYAFVKFNHEGAALDFIRLVKDTQLKGSKSAKRLTAEFAVQNCRVRELPVWQKP